MQAPRRDRDGSELDLGPGQRGRRPAGARHLPRHAGDGGGRRRRPVAAPARRDRQRVALAGDRAATAGTRCGSTRARGSARILGERVDVATYHHQGVGEHPGLNATAWSDDGLLEAFEDNAAAFRLGVQWHPEVGDDPRLFEALVEAATAPRRDRDRAPDVRRRGRGGRPARGARSSDPGADLAAGRRARSALGSSSRPRTSSGWAPSSSAAPSTPCRASRAEQRRAGVVAYSSGNHAQAIALAARLLEPAGDDRHAARRAGQQGRCDARPTAGRVVTYDRYTEDREQIAQQLVERARADPRAAVRPSGRHRRPGHGRPRS